MIEEVCFRFFNELAASLLIENLGSMDAVDAGGVRLFETLANTLAMPFAGNAWLVNAGYTPPSHLAATARAHSWSPARVRRRVEIPLWTEMVGLGVSRYPSRESYGPSRCNSLMGFAVGAQE